jgi:PA14 domain
MLLHAIANAGVVPLRVVAPRTNCVGPGCPDIAPGDTTYRVGSPLTDLKEILIRGVRFDVPGDTIEVGRFPATAGDTIAFDFEGEDGVQGELLSYAVDLSGNVGCRGASTVFAIPAVDHGAPGLLGSYYRDKTLTSLVGTRIDPQINFDWVEFSPFPGCPPDSFSVRWTGFIRTSATGLYQFRLRVNDAARMWVGPWKVLDDWATGDGWHDVGGSAPLTGGVDYSITVEMFEKWYISGAQLYWTQPGVAETLVPTSALSH